MAIDPEQARAALLQRKAEIEREQAATEADRAPVTLDQTTVGRLSRVSALQDQAMALAVHQRRKSELARIEAALRRIEQGEYGLCVRCGEGIGEKRLAHDPAVATCIKCAEERGA